MPLINILQPHSENPQATNKQNVSGLNANLLESNSIFPNGLSAFVVAGIPAQDESLWQPQGAVLALALGHHHTQEKDQQDDQSCHS